MSESPTTPTLQPTGRRQPAPPERMLDNLALVLRASVMLPSMQWADTMHVPAACSHTRLHCLAESALRDAALAALAELWKVPPPRRGIYAVRSDLAPLDQSQSQLQRSAEAILLLCTRAGFPQPEVVAALVLAALLRGSAQLYGHLRQEGGVKAWEREMHPALRATRELAAWMASVDGDTTRGALAQRPEEVLQWEFHSAASHHGARPVGELLPGLLERSANGLEAQLAAVARKTGRPATPDALLFAVECLLDIWQRFHPRPPSMRAKVDGFVGWAEPLLRLAVEANDAGGGMGKAGSDMLGRTTLRRVLIDAVARHRREAPVRHSHPEELRPGWKQGRASDECAWSDLPELAGHAEDVEPSLRGAMRRSEEHSRR
jgi:hypothetical protein